MLLALLIGCGLNIKAVPTQDIWADNGDARQEKGVVQFAVVGDTRQAGPTDPAKGRVATPGTGSLVAADISARIQREEVDFVVLLGDLVRASSTAEWKRFTKDWSLVLSGSEPPETGALRVRSIPVAGDADRVGDERLRGFGAAFPGVGLDIGFGRVASWYVFDVESRRANWRFLVLDSDKAALGSRWKEQLEWLPTALEGDYDGLLVFMHHPALTLARGETADEGGGPSELLSVIDDETKVGALKAVFSAHANTNEVYLPGGKFGELFVVAGGGGAPASSLPRWGTVEGKDIKLETVFDLALVKEFDKWMEAKGHPESARDKARGGGEWKGFTAEFDARYMPIQGWWSVTLDGPDLSLGFRMVSAEGKVKELYTLECDDKDGWLINR